MRKRKLWKAAAGILGMAFAFALGSGSAEAQTDSQYGSSRMNLGSGGAADASTSDGSTSAGTASGETQGAASAAADVTGTASPRSGGPAFAPGAADIMLLSSADLAVGMTGGEVATLQGFLAELGFLDLTGIGGPTGYYGPMTRDAVARYQSAIGVPATGYFGPMTRSAMAMHFVRNDWMGDVSGGAEGSGIGGGESSDLVAGSADAGTGGPDMEMTGVFSATNPGAWFNGVWYPNAVDMSVRAPASAASASGPSGTTTNAGASATDDDGTDDATGTTSADDRMGP
ncbi:MAG: peptidoglycan-binding protein [Candidatus Taylorbacteria bacterium]|nr:peptidoglycan-binding protein [Candidatus Taylorbacteria bacterium]